MDYTRFKTLNKILKKELQDWQNSNSTLKEFRYPCLQKIIINLSDKSLSFTVMLFFLSLIINFSIVQWNEHLTPFFPQQILNEFKLQDLINYFSTLWTIQTTLAALVYPIVIGFVGILLQSRQSAKARLRIYLTDSAAVLAGLSSLFLVLSMAIQYIFIVKVHDDALIGWILVNTIWFVFNCIGTIYFLIRTFDFLSPDTQNKVIVKYAVNIALPDKIIRSLKYNFFCGAQEYGLLPGPIYSKGQIKKEEPHILLHPLFSDQGVPVVTIKLESPHKLSDVRFNILKWTINNWRKRAKSISDNKTGEQNLESQLQLIFPLMPERTYKNEVVLCRQAGNVSLLWWEKILIRYSFDFRRKEASELSAIDKIFEDIQSDILANINNRNVQAFKEYLMLITDLHVTLINCCIFKNDSGEIDNYANLADSGDLFEKSIAYKWARVYIDIFSSCVSLLGDNAEYFEYAAYIPKRLFDNCKENNAKTFLEHIIKLQPSLFRRLGIWWANIAEEQGEYLHDFCIPVDLKPPHYSMYHSAMNIFVGAWEGLGKIIFHIDRSKIYQWKELSSYGYLFEVHLKQTLYMVLECTARGDKDAAESMTDVLQKWLSEISYSLYDVADILRREKLINVSLFTRDWEHVENSIDLEPHYYKRSNITSAVFAACLKNYWIDGCCIMIYLLTNWGKNCNCKNNLPFLFVKTIIEGKELRAGGGGIHNNKPLNSLDDAFTSLLRQHFTDKDYDSRLNSIISNLQGISEPEMISGRVYTWGAHDLNSIKDGQIILLCILAKSGWEPAETLSKYILHLSSNDSIAREMIEFFNSMIKRLDDPKFLEWKNAFLCIRELEIDNNEFDTAKERVKNQIQKFVDFIDKQRDERLQSAPISQTRLLEVAGFASSSAFKKETAGLPIHFFKEIKSSRTTFNERHVRFKDLEKGKFTEPLLTQLAINENEWYAEIIKKHVAGFVMADILNSVDVISVDGSSPDKYWSQLRDAANKLTANSLKPILLVENRMIPRWIWDWGWPENEDRFKKPDDLSVDRIEGEMTVKEYIGHFNDIAVYSAPTSPGASYVFALETFKEITFTEFNNGHLIDVSYEATPNFAIIDLILKWGQSINLETYPVTQIKYNDMQEEE